MKVTKDTMAGRYFVTGSSGLPSSRNDSAETEPVHTIVADRDAAGGGFFAAEHSRTERKSRQRVSNDVSPGDEDRRKHDRRQRQVDVLLDTRMIPRRQGRSINEKA